MAFVFGLRVSAQKPKKINTEKTNKSLVTKTNTRHPLMLILSVDHCISFFYLFLIEVLELAEFKAGMVEHPVTGKILREKTLDSLLATM